MVAERTLLWDGIAHHLAMPENNREQVVEIVCDAASEASDRFHFLGLTELVFKKLPVGDVGVDADVPGRLPILPF